jgi:hypothetical protein
MTNQSHAQTQTSTSTTTGVFALLRAKPGVTRERVMAVMPAEIRATVQLYLDGKIREWYSREDGRGGVFLLNTGDVEEKLPELRRRVIQLGSADLFERLAEIEKHLHD